MNNVLAIKTHKNYRCSVCWGELEMMQIENGGWDCVCVKYGKEHAGYHHKAYVERCQTDSHFDLLEVKRMLQGIGVLETPPKQTQEEILQELGF